MSGPFVRDRLPAAVAGLLGVLAAVPMVFWPTYSYAPAEGREDPTGVAFEPSFWVWGRSADTSPQGPNAFDIGNSVGLVVFVLALCAGLAGVGVLALRRGPDGRVLGAAGIAFAAAYVIGPLANWLGLSRADVFTADVRLVVLPAGWLEMASAVLLVVAVALVALPSVIRLARSAHTWSRGVVQRRRAVRAVVEANGEEGAGVARPKVGIATIRDLPGDREARAVVRREHHGSGVGFSDDQTSDPDRFRPPR